MFLEEGYWVVCIEYVSPNYPKKKKHAQHDPQTNPNKAHTNRPINRINTRQDITACRSDNDASRHTTSNINAMEHRRSVG